MRQVLISLSVSRDQKLKTDMLLTLLASHKEPEIICLVVFINCDNVWRAGLMMQ